MRKYVIHILRVSLPIILLAFTADYWFSSQLKKSTALAYGEIAVWNDIYNDQLSANILVYGSSRAWNHFDPATLESYFKSTVYNVGIDGYDFGMQYFRHQQILENNPKPTSIILSLDVFMFENRGKLITRISLSHLCFGIRIGKMN